MKAELLLFLQMNNISHLTNWILLCLLFISFMHYLHTDMKNNKFTKREKYSYNEIIKEKKENKEEIESNTCISALFDNNIVYVNAHTMNINGEDNIRRVRNVKCEIYLEGCMHAR